jgi:hypothetical protein
VLSDSITPPFIELHRAVEEAAEKLVICGVAATLRRHKSDEFNTKMAG